MPSPRATISASTNADPLLSRTEAAEYLGMKIGTLEVWASTGRYNLPFIKVGRIPKYRKSSLDAWIQGRTRYGHANADNGMRKIP